MLHTLKRHIPASWLRAYHFTMAHVAAFAYGYPSRRLTVIGVTGTNGKSSTAQFIGQLLMTLGERVGWTTTDSFRVADRVVANKKKMTMLGRGATQKLLQDMVRAKCGYAIVETSSQGVQQFRHVGIEYRAMVLTNLTPEHIEAHGGFEAYKQAKLKAFRVLEGKRGVFSVVNLGADFVEEFASVDVETVVGFGRDDKPMRDVLVDRRVIANNIRMGKEGTDAEIDGERVHVPLLGSFSFENALAAIATVVQLGHALPDVLRAAQSLQPIPGRLERFPFKGGEVIVDYAPEPYALNALYDVVKLLKPTRIIHVFGSCGGGRDVARRAVMGCMASEQDDIAIVTNEDPYDDDPMEIINAIARAAAQNGKKDGVDLFRVLDREEAIQKAVEMAREGDLVLVTGKGSEPVMAVAGGKKVPSDDREFVRRALAKKSV